MDRSSDIVNAINVDKSAKQVIDDFFYKTLCAEREVESLELTSDSWREQVMCWSTLTVVCAFFFLGIVWVCVAMNLIFLCLRLTA